MLTTWSDTSLAVSGGCGVALLLWLLLAPDARHRALQPLPCPPSTLPVLGNTLDLMFIQLPRLHDWILEQCLLHKGHTWRLQALGAPPLVVVSSVACFEDVLKTQFEIFDKGVRMNAILRSLTGDGIFSVDGDKWKQQRKALSHLFTMRKFRDSICDAIQRHLQIFGNVLDQAVKNNQEICGTQTLFPLSGAFHRYAFDTFTEIAFGVDENTLAATTGSGSGSDSSATDSAFLTACTDATKLVELRFHQPDWLWKLKRLLNISHERKLSAAVDIIDRKVYDVVAKTLERSRQSDAKQSSRQDVLSILMDHMDEFKHGDDNDDAGDNDPVKLSMFLRDAGFSLIAAGKDSTGATLTWVMIMLARQPQVLQTIRTELREKLPRLFTDKTYVPSMDDVESQLVYLEAVVRETLRLCPLAPLNAKEANQDATLCDGTFMKKGTRVYIPSYALGRMPSVWGSDAAEYNPERWITRDPTAARTATLKSFSSFQFVAFHAGPRICLGMRFALLQLKTTLAFILSKYDFTLEKDPHAYTYEMAITFALKGDLRATVTKLKT